MLTVSQRNAVDTELMMLLETTRRIGQIIRLCDGEIPVYADLTYEKQQQIKDILCAKGLDLTAGRSLFDSCMYLMYEVEPLCSIHVEPDVHVAKVAHGPLARRDHSLRTERVMSAIVEVEMRGIYQCLPREEHPTRVEDDRLRRIFKSHCLGFMVREDML